MSDCVVFDMDGVLVGSGPAHAASWKAVARRHGVQISDGQFQATFGRTSREIISMLWGDQVDEAAAKRIDEEKEAFYRELVRGMVPLTIGVRETLRGLQAAEIPMAIATSGPRENVDLVLDEARLRPFFRAIVTGQDVPRGKPAPDVFLLAAERLACVPGACVVVEDAPVGIEAAHAAGMRVAALIGTHTATTLEGAGAERVVERLSEITPELVREMLR